MSFPIGAIAGLGGLLGGLFGGQQDDPKLPPELRWIYGFLKQNAQGLRRYGRSPALSSPEERSALASARAQFGNDAAAKRAQGYAALGGEASTGSGGLADFMSNLAGQEVSGLSSIYTQHLLNSLNEHRAAKYAGSSQIASMATSAAGGPRTPQPTNPDLGGILGQLAGAYAFSQARQSPGQGAPSSVPVAPITGVGSNSAIGGDPQPIPVGSSMMGTTGAPPGLDEAQRRMLRNSYLGQG